MFSSSVDAIDLKNTPYTIPVVGVRVIAIICIVTNDLAVRFSSYSVIISTSQIVDIPTLYKINLRWKPYKSGTVKIAQVW